MTDTPNKIVIADAFKHLPVGGLGQGIMSGFNWIGTKDKVFSLHYQGEKKPFLRPDDGTPSPYLDVVILAENPNTSKIYYENMYTQNSASPPDCASVNGKEPDAGVPKPQSKVCGTCKWDRFNSAPNGGRGKACQDHKRVAVLILPYMTKNMLAKPLIEPVFLKIPPDSLRPWKAYDESLTNRGAPYASVITRISWTPGKQHQFTFTMKQPLTNKEAEVVLPLLQDPQTLNLIGSGMVAERNTAPALPEPEETGLLEAFAPETEVADNAQEVISPPTKPKGPGRPKGSINKPKLVETIVPRVDENGEEAASEEDGEQPYEEASGGLSDRVADLLKSKVSKMLE